MNATDTRPASRATDDPDNPTGVAAFVAEVRRHLDDLDIDTREELTGGLEADLADQLADGATLADPATYAAELRSAAGLPDRRRFDVNRLRHDPGRLLDRGRDWFLRQATSPRLRPAWDILITLRPAWWVARAWIAVTLLDVVVGPWEPISVVPTLGLPMLGSALLIAAIVVSTLIGVGRLWPGSGPDRPATARALLLACNVVAIVAPLTWSIPWPPYVSGEPNRWDTYGAGWMDAERQHRGLEIDGEKIHNIFAYDADGNPIDQVQLVDQDGRPIAIRLRDATQKTGAGRTVGCPARNGDASVPNVFPLATVEQRRGLCSETSAEALRPKDPLAVLPPVIAAWPAPADADEIDPDKADPSRSGKQDDVRQRR